MDEAFCGLSIQNVCRIVFEFAEKDCIIHLFNKQNKMAGLNFVKGFANPANKSKKVTLKSSKKLNKTKEKVIFNRSKRLGMSSMHRNVFQTGRRMGSMYPVQVMVP